MPREVGLAVVGLGRMGRLYAEIVSRVVEGVRLVAVWSRSRAKCEEVARELGARCVETIEGIARDESVEGVIVATPSYTHADIAAIFVEAGKPVFVEKPIDVDLGKASKLVSLAERKGVPLLVGYMRRFHPDYRRAKEVVESGELGEPVAYVGVSKDPEPPPPGWLRDPRLSGGLVLDLASHDFDLARWFLGEEPIEVYAVGGELCCPGLGDFDTIVATIRFGRKVATVFSSRKSSYGYDVRSEVHCTEGAVFIGSTHVSTLAIARSQSIAFPGVSWFQKKFFEAYVEEVKHFARVVKGLEKPLVSGVDALKALCVAVAVRRSLEDGKPHAVPC